MVEATLCGLAWLSVIPVGVGALGGPERRPGRTVGRRVGDALREAWGRD